MTPSWLRRVRPYRLHTSLIATAAIAVLIKLIFAMQMYPVADGDATAFMPAALDERVHGTLYNRIYTLSYTTDPQALGRFLYYPPLFPWLVGRLAAGLGVDGYPGIFLALAVVQSIGIGAFTLIVMDIYRKATSRNAQSQWLWLALCHGCLLSYGLFLFPSNGRPEILAMTLITASLAFEYFNVTRRFLWQCLIIPLTIATSLVAGMILLSMYMLYFVWRNPSEVQAIRNGVILFIATCAVLYSSYYIAGVNLADSVYALQIRAAHDARRTDSSPQLVLQYYWGWAAFLALAIAAAVPPILRSFRRAAILHRLMLIAGLSILGFELWFFGLRVAPIHYNWYAFLPVYQVLILLALLNNHPGHVVTFLSGGLLCLIAIGISLVSPARAIALFPYYMLSEKTYQEAKVVYQHLHSTHSECSMLYTSGLSVLDEEQTGRIYPAFDPVKIATEQNRSCAVVLVQEVNGAANWIQVPGATTLLDWRDSSPLLPILRRARLLNNPQGYSFIAYRVELQDQ